MSVLCQIKSYVRPEMSTSLTGRGQTVPEPSAPPLPLDLSPIPFYGNVISVPADTLEVRCSPY